MAVQSGGNSELVRSKTIAKPSITYFIGIATIKELRKGNPDFLSQGLGQKKVEFEIKSEFRRNRTQTKR